MKSSRNANEKSLNTVAYYGLAHEICARVEDDPRKLTDDERIVISVIAAQAALAKYAEPGDQNAEAILNKLLRILGHREMISTMMRKMHRLIKVGEHASTIAV
jgi:hypothetical protein